MKRFLVRLAAAWVALLIVVVSAEAQQAWRVVRKVRLLTSSGQKIKTLHPPDIVTQQDSREDGNYIEVVDTAGDLGWVYKPYLAQTTATGGMGGPGSTIPTGPLAPDEMRAHFIDVGQGASTLLEFACGAVLVDTGGEKDADFDSNDHLLNYLTAFFSRRTDLNKTLDLVLLSHPHLDHTRGVETVLQNFNVRNVVDDGLTTGSGGPQQVALETFAHDNPGVGYRAVKVGDISQTTGLTSPVIDPINCSGTDPRIRVLWGQVGSSSGWSASDFNNANNHSVIVRIDFGQASFLLPGDLEDVAMPDLVQRYSSSHLLDADVYEVDHHGSKNGVTASLLGAVTPKIVVISMGPADRELPWTAWQYGHPNQGTVDLIASHVSEARDPIHEPLGTGSKHFVNNQEIHSAIYATGWDGTVIIEARADGSLHVNH